MTFLRIVTFTFWSYYVLKLLRLETIVMLRFVAVPTKVYLLVSMLRTGMASIHLVDLLLTVSRYT